MFASKTPWRALGVAAIGLLPCAALAAPISLTVDANRRHQTIDGFGTALSWWAHNAYTSNAFRDMYYRDLGASMLRMDFHINALKDPSGDLAKPVVLGPNIDDNIKKFNFGVTGPVTPGEFVKVAGQKKLDEFKLIGSVWSPPHWMKGPEYDWQGRPTGRMPTLNQTTALDSAGGTLIDTPENITQFARYVAAYVKGMEQAYGVPVHAISLQNELILSEPYNSAVYTPQLYVKTLKAVGREFRANGITTKIQGPEDVGVGTPDNPWILWRQMQFVNAVRADSEARQYLDIYSIHGYAGDAVSPGGTSGGKQMWGQYLDGRSEAQYPTPQYAWWNGIRADGKPNWMTEQSGNVPAWLNTDASGAQNGALWSAVMLHEALVYGDVSAYLHWQTADGKPVGTATLTSGTDTSSKKYNAAKHFYRYIRPGAQRLEMTTGIDGVLASAYVHDGQQSLALVLVNTGGGARELEIDINSVLGRHLFEAFDAYRTSGTESFASLSDVLVQDGRLRLTLPQHSVTTLYAMVPEPAAGLAGAALMGLFLRRRRHA